MNFRNFRKKLFSLILVLGKAKSVWQTFFKLPIFCIINCLNIWRRSYAEIRHFSLSKLSLKVVLKQLRKLFHLNVANVSEIFKLFLTVTHNEIFSIVLLSCPRCKYLVYSEKYISHDNFFMISSCCFFWAFCKAL